MDEKLAVIVRLRNQADYTDSINDILTDADPWVESDEDIIEQVKQDACEDFGWDTDEIEVSIRSKGEKYPTAFHWLEKAVEQGDVSEKDLLRLVYKAGSADDIQHVFQSLMAEYGYFDEE